MVVISPSEVQLVKGLGTRIKQGNMIFGTVEEGNLSPNLTMINTDNASQPWPKAMHLLIIFFVKDH